MNWQEIVDQWGQVTEKIYGKWGKLNESDLTSIAGNRDSLIRLLMSRYHWNQEVTENKVDDFARDLKSETLFRNNVASTHH